MHKNLLVALVGITDDILALTVMFEIVFGVALPKLGLFLVQLMLVYLFLVFFVHLTVQILTDIFLLAETELTVLFIFLLFSFLLKSHIFIDFVLFHLYHLFLLFHDGVVLLVDKFKSFLFTSGKFILS